MTGECTLTMKVLTKYKYNFVRSFTCYIGGTKMGILAGPHFRGQFFRWLNVFGLNGFRSGFGWG